MRKFLVILFVFFTTFFNVIAIAGTRYTSFYGQNGQVIFFKPYKITAKGNDVLFEYDMTYVERNDSMILNFSIVSPTPIKVKGFKISNSTLQFFPSYCKRLYVDLYKKKYITRMQTSFRYEELRNIFTAPEQYCFEVMTVDNELMFEDKKSSWNKEHKKLTEIFSLTNLNN